MDSRDLSPKLIGKQPSNAPKRQRLAAVCLLCALCIAITLRWTRLHKPTLPTNASLETQRAYWKQRIKSDISDCEAYLRLGILEERSGYFLSAVKYLKAARALGAEEREICAPLGRALTHLAQDEEALVELEKARKLDPDSVEVVANMAGLGVTEEQPNTAKEVLHQFLKSHPRLDDASLRRLMFCFMECGDNDTAQSLATQILTLLPQDLIAHSVLARCALAKSDAQTSLRHLETIMESVKNDAGLYFLYGNTLEALGKRQEALTAWQQAIALNPRALDVYEQIGKAYWERKEFAKAAVAFEALAQRAPSRTTALRAMTALEKAGQSEHAHYWRAVALGFVGDFVASIAEAKPLVNSSDPALRALGLQALAEAYRGLRQRENYLQTMLQLTAKKTATDLMLMAQAYAELDKFDKRTECLLQALEKATPQDKGAIYYQLGLVYQTRGMQDEAEKAISQALTADDKNPLYYRGLAEIYFSRRTLEGRLERAVEAWEHALALAPEEASNWQHLGVAYLAQGQTLKAITTLEHAIDLEPGSGPAYLELSKAYRKLNDDATSQHYMEVYQKYVLAEQRRQTLRTRARREKASASDLIAYGDLVVQMGDLNDALNQYERAALLIPKDIPLQKKLISLYDRLRMPERRLQLEKRLATQQRATP